MCYDGALVMPSGYAMMDEGEMPELRCLQFRQQRLIHSGVQFQNLDWEL